MTSKYIRSQRKRLDKENKAAMDVAYKYTPMMKCIHGEDVEVRRYESRTAYLERTRGEAEKGLAACPLYNWRLY